MSEIKEWQQFTSADIRDANLSNCTKCFKLIDYAYITTGEVMCADCYFKTIENKNILFYKELNKETIRSNIGDKTNETK